MFRGEMNISDPQNSECKRVLVSVCFQLVFPQDVKLTEKEVTSE